ncbi:hypothetical protein SH528x_001623 [Novipirellula sp. SH528]|uniref:hypothetical protein n=1 Tax=Novipirellula sp. SH528 TaxID=3454466 RepID=UPI003FA0D947
MSHPSKLKKPLLYGLIGSVLFGAVLGIFFVLRNTWSWFEVQVVLTALVIAVSSLCGLACDMTRTPSGRNLLPASGLILTGIAAALLLLGIWTTNDSEVYWKTTSCLSILAVTAVHVCLLSIAKLASRFRWVFFIGSQVIFGYSLLLCGVILGEIDTSGVWRLIAALSIVVAAISIVIPILHRISKLERQGDAVLGPVEQRNIATIDEEIERLKARIIELEQLKKTHILVSRGP